MNNDAYIRESDAYLRYRKVMDGVPPGVRLVAVCKKQPRDAIAGVYHFGQRHFGENYLQEAEEKWQTGKLLEQCPDAILHFIGRLQSNKVRKVVQLFDVVGGICSVRTLEAVANEEALHGKNAKKYLQLNLAEEESKFGLTLKEAEAVLSSDAGKLVDGLMQIPPANSNVPFYFLMMSQLGASFGVKELSMGMSSDYKLAIELGATEVRVGSSIFGPRQSAPPPIARD